jgi:hypothetical protein
MLLAGFFFLYIIVILNIATYRYNYEIFSDLNSEAKLKKIAENPKGFKIGVVLGLTEHAAIIIIPTMLFIAFYSYSIVLAIVWTISRIGEGLIHIYHKKSYWGLLKIAGQYSVSGDADKKKQIDRGREILEATNSIFSFTQILFSIGTLAYSILFVIYGVLPPILGWFGIAAGIIYGLGNVVVMAKPKVKAVWNLGGLLILIFEFILGVSLIYYSIF